MSYYYYDRLCLDYLVYTFYGKYKAYYIHIMNSEIKKQFSIETEIIEIKNDIKELKNTIKELVEMMNAVYEFEDT